MRTLTATLLLLAWGCGFVGVVSTTIEGFSEQDLSLKMAGLAVTLIYAAALPMLIASFGTIWPKR